MRRRILALLLAAALALTLCGCLKSTEELYALPRLSDEYKNLQTSVSAVLGSDAEYSAPVSGSNRQAIQLADLDGDGEYEAIAFVRTTGEMPLKAYIFTQVGGEYQNTAIIEGSGSSFLSVEYLQLDGAGGAELIVGWQVSNQVTKAISVYSLRDQGVVELMNASCSAYRTVDLDSDGHSELFLVHFRTDEQTGVAELYRYQNDAMERLPEARLSGGVTAISRIATGYVAEDVPAVFVTGFYEESELVTDVFAMSDGNMQNLAEADPIGAAPRVRDYYVYATDVDSDGITELPKPIPLSTSGDSAGYWIIEWYGLAPDGTRTRKMRTFHNYQSSGGWYLALPDDWENPAIYRGNNVGGVSGYVFARWDQQGKGGELFTLYAFTGERRMELAEADGRFILAEKGETVYSAALGEGRGDLTEDDLRAMFRFIKIDWNTGEM